MKILHLCTYDTGGAANAALRLHEGLKRLGQESVFASRTTAVAAPDRVAVIKPQGDWIARQAPRIEYHLARLLFPMVRPVLTRGLLPGFGLRAMEVVQPDIVNLHWVDHGMISTRDLARLAASGIPLVWTLHDMVPLTGGFGYREVVGLQPAALGPLTCGGTRAAASRALLDRRRQALESAHLTVVAPSHWLAEEARRSPVFEKHRVVHIPYGIDTSVFLPLNREAARNRWNLPQDARVILFGADTFDDTRKGMHHLKAALARMNPPPDGQPLLLVGFGNRADLKPDDFPIPVQGLGRLSSAEDIAMLYSAADVFVCPSREDNLPNTMVESLACGTPVTGFQVGGLMDLVLEGITGSLARCYDEAGLACALEQVLYAAPEKRAEMRYACRHLAEFRLNLGHQATGYEAIYRDMLSKIPA